MAKRSKPSSVSPDFAPYLHGVGKYLLEKVYGPNGMPWGTKFADLEEVAVQLGQEISREIVNQAVNRQAADQEVIPAESKICQCCGRPMETEDPEPRIVATRVGGAEWSEPKRYCGRCRKAFFPSVEESGN